MRSSELETFITDARASAYFAASRLGHREPLFPHQLAVRTYESMHDNYRNEVNELLELNYKSKLQPNFEYLKSLHTCKTATEAVVQVLQGTAINPAHSPKRMVEMGQSVLT